MLIIHDWQILLQTVLCFILVKIENNELDKWKKSREKLYKVKISFVKKMLITHDCGDKEPKLKSHFKAIMLSGGRALHLCLG